MSAAKGNAYSDIYDFRSISVGSARMYPVRGRKDAGRLQSALYSWVQRELGRAGARPVFQTRSMDDMDGKHIRVWRKS